MSLHCAFVQMCWQRSAHNHMRLARMMVCNTPTHTRHVKLRGNLEHGERRCAKLAEEVRM